jgi:multidrug efflux pump subunit AcrA (membrane-fusion protein)
MNSEKQKIVYSEPVNDIISVPPGRVVTSGTTMIFGLFILLFIIGWAIKYPDIIVAPVEITTENPPATMISKLTGRIKDIYVNDGAVVDSGSLLAVMETTASINDVLRLKETIGKYRKPTDIEYSSLQSFASLGELQEFYSSFQKALSDYDTYIKYYNSNEKIKSVKKQIAEQEEYMRRLAYNEKIMRQNLMSQKELFKKDSLLYVQEVLPQGEFEKSKQSLNTSRFQLQQILTEESQASVSLSEKNQILIENTSKEKVERKDLESTLNEAFQNLNAHIGIWESNYLLIAPVTGTVALTEIWSKNQTVIKDQQVLKIVPFSRGKFIGRISLPMNRSGKVVSGMPVNIKLSGYPYMEYGMIRGIVKYKSAVASGDKYIIEVSLPDGLTTQYGKKLDFTQDMQGQAEIVTEKLRLIERIINPFRYMISRNKSLK